MFTEATTEAAVAEEDFGDDAAARAFALGYGTTTEAVAEEDEVPF